MIEIAVEPRKRKEEPPMSEHQDERATDEIAATVDRLFYRDPEVQENPYPLYKQLRESGPTHWVAGGEGAPRWRNKWHVFGYDDVANGLRDLRLSSAQPMATPAQAAPAPEGLTAEQQRTRAYFWRAMAEPSMITTDPPDHTRLRRIVAAAFVPRAVVGMQGTIVTCVNDLLDEATADGAAFDLVRNLAYQLPTILIAALLGLPTEDWARVKALSDGLITFFPQQRNYDQLYELHEYWRALIAERKAAPRDDLLSSLIAARDHGDVFSDDELIGQLTLLLVAGHETTTYALGSAVLHLLRDPERWASLADLPIEPAVEELLRYDPPFQALTRVAASDLELGGVQIRAGDQVQLWLAAANRDPARFADPDRLDLTRTDNRHLTFGLGTHFCLGSALARLELQTALTVLRDRFPGLRLAQEEVPRRHDSAIRGPASLPVIAA
jgi:cytochrome P450